MSDSLNKDARINELLLKYLANQLSGEEKAELDRWISASEENLAEFESATDRKMLSALVKGDADSKSIWNKITERTSLSLVPAIGNKRWWIYGIAAAAIPLLIICGWLLFSPMLKTGDKNKVALSEIKDIIPGKDRATLTLADGSTILLDEAKNGSLTTQGNSFINKRDGELIYRAEANKQSGAIIYNTVSTPRGGQYRLKLSDGSEIWLNSASVLRFPVNFDHSDNRTVYMKGEGYFSINKNPLKPFKVIVEDEIGRNTEVEVLGTQFNLNSYANEEAITTTLIEGKVKIVSSQSGKSLAQKIFLSPGQQAQVLTSGILKKSTNVDTSAIIAWKNGVFGFGATNIKAVMRQIERWYDVDVIYKGEIPQIDYVGEISKYSTVSKVLDVIAINGSIKYYIEGKKVFILPP